MATPVTPPGGSKPSMGWTPGAASSAVEESVLLQAVNDFLRSGTGRALLNNNSDVAFPPGLPVPWLGDKTTVPVGWIWLDGSLVPVNDNPNCFSVWGHSYNGGVDPGSGQFKIPDFTNGRSPVSAGTGASGTVFTLGAIGGADLVALTAAQSGVNGNGTTGNDSPDHSHVDPMHRTGNEVGGYGLTVTGAFQDRVYVDQSFAGAQPSTSGRNVFHQHPLNARNADATHSVMSPYTVVGGWIVKAG